MTGAAPRLIASDVDGTLLGDDELVPRANREAIADAVAAGARFVLATGRPPRWLPVVVEQLPVAPISVCANGSVTVDTATGEYLAAHLLEPDVLSAIDDVVGRRLPGAGIAAERSGEDAADAEFVADPDYEHAWLQPEHLDVGHADVLARPALKLLARLPGARSADMVAALGDELAGIADVTFSTTNGLIEFSVAGVTKARALDDVARRFVDPTPTDEGVPWSVAFGDMPNDIAMLRWAGLGVAMGNALPEVVAAADRSTLRCEEAGVAHVLRTWW